MTMSVVVMQGRRSAGTCRAMLAKHATNHEERSHRATPSMNRITRAEWEKSMTSCQAGS